MEDRATPREVGSNLGLGLLPEPASPDAYRKYSAAQMHAFSEAHNAELIKRVRSAYELLKRCDAAFSSFIMGRRMARKERDKLRDDINRWLDGRA